MNPTEIPPEPALSSVVIPLLKGVVYQENAPLVWASLVALDARVRDYVGVLDLDLVLDEPEGYAFLRSREHDSANDQEKSATFPRLFPRRQLSFPVSLLLALLRKKLAEFDVSGDNPRLILSRDEIIETVRLFLPSQSNEARLIDQVEAQLNKIAELGFVRKLKGTPGGHQPAAYEVRRILKSFVDAQWLADFDARLDVYRRHLESPGPEQHDD